MALFACRTLRSFSKSVTRPAKVHALVDANGNPIALKLSASQAHDARSAADMLDGLGVGQILEQVIGSSASKRVASCGIKTSKVASFVMSEPASASWTAAAPPRTR